MAPRPLDGSFDALGTGSPARTLKPTAPHDEGSSVLAEDRRRNGLDQSGEKKSRRPAELAYKGRALGKPPARTDRVSVVR